MSFLSIPFLLFFIVVVLLFLLAKGVWQKRVLILASVFSIGWISMPFLAYALLICIVNYGIANYISLYKSGSLRKTIYIAGQVINIGGIIIYKYLGFVLENFDYVLKTEIAENKLLQFVIPLGISYYTFQAISYLYLVWKAGDKPEKDFGDFVLYMLFFPKFLAGPIERHRKFLPQLKVYQLSINSNVREGLRLILWGALKKVMLGDTLGIIVTKVYSNVEGFHTVPLWVTFFLQPLHIYGDFSGYTDMAIGLSKLFGIQLSPNFNRPFFAKSIAQFWKRWHISLSSWCNDFIYNRLLLKHRRKGNLAVVYALFMTFMLIGIWHGAKWTFIVVGILQVIALVYEFYTKKWRLSLFSKLPDSLGNLLSYLVVYLYVAFFLVFFFAHNLNDAWIFISGMLSFSDLNSVSWGLNIPHIDFLMAVLSIVIVIGIEFAFENKKNVIHWFNSWPVALRWACYYTTLFVVVHFAKNALFFTYADF